MIVFKYEDFMILLCFEENYDCEKKKLLQNQYFLNGIKEYSKDF